MRSNKHIVLIDIGSSSVAAAVVKYEPKENPNVLFHVREPIRIQEELDVDRFISHMTSALKNVLTLVQQQGIIKTKASNSGEKIERVVCVLSSPWYTGDTKQIFLNEEQPFTVTKDFIDNIIDDVVAQYKDEDLTNLKHESIHMQDAVLVDEQVMEVRLNDYPTRKPVGKKTTSMTLSIYLSVMAGSMKNEIQETIGTFFNHDVDFHAFPLVGSRALQSLFSREDHFLMMDVTGEVSDIALISGDIVAQSGSFSVGHNALIRYVTEALGISVEEARSRIAMHLEDAGDTEAVDAASLERALTSFYIEWGDELKKTLKFFAETTPIPGSVFLVANQETAPWFEKAIEYADWSEILFSAHPFRIINLTERQLGSCCTFASKGSSDPFLALGAVFASTLDEEH